MSTMCHSDDPAWVATATLQVLLNYAATALEIDATRTTPLHPEKVAERDAVARRLRDAAAAPLAAPEEPR